MKNVYKAFIQNINLLINSFPWKIKSQLIPEIAEHLLLLHFCNPKLHVYMVAEEEH